MAKMTTTLQPVDKAAVYAPLRRGYSSMWGTYPSSALHPKEQ